MTLATAAATAQNRIFPRRTLEGALADSLRTRLFAHEFPPCASLDEAALTAHYGVGHLPVSKALEQLFFERLLVARPHGQGGYEVPGHTRADIENLLDTLERIRRLALLQRMEKTAQGDTQDSAQDDIIIAVEMPFPSRPYWGPAGLEVTRPFVVAAQSLYDQLCAGVGPALSEIEADCAKQYEAAMTKALASGSPEILEEFCWESAWNFRQRVLRTAILRTATLRTATSPAQKHAQPQEGVPTRKTPGFFDDTTSQKASGPGGIQQNFLQILREFS